MGFDCILPAGFSGGFLAHSVLFYFFFFFEKSNNYNYTFLLFLSFSFSLSLLLSPFFSFFSFRTSLAHFGIIPVITENKEVIKTPVFVRFCFR